MKRKILKLCSLLAALLVTAILFTACGDKGNPFLGAWDDDDSEQSFIFNEDGTGAQTSYSGTIEFTYTWDGDTATITNEEMGVSAEVEAVNRDGSLNYFEPAVFTPPLYDACQERLGMLADFAEASENIVTNTTHQEPNSERTLVIIKPDNWRCPSVKPGNIIDMLSRTGLRIVGCKIYQMSVAEALEFYGPVQNALRKKLAPVIGKKAYDKLSEEFGLKFHPASEQMLTESIGRDYADDQFNKIVEFMSGRRPDECPTEELNRPGKVKCMILIYEGPDAVRKIRDVLGPTDPTKAPGGTIRREFGHDVMVNTAHASDSKESFERETKIIKIQNNPMAAIIRAHLASMKQ